jgi:hypothetical protein
VSIDSTAADREPPDTKPVSMTRIEQLLDELDVARPVPP